MLNANPLADEKDTFGGKIMRAAGVRFRCDGFPVEPDPERLERRSGRKTCAPRA